MVILNVKTFRRNVAWKSERGCECFSQRLKKAEYRLKTEQLMKANFKVHPKLLCQLLNTTSFNKSHILTE